jgi:hypothetical protein
MMSPESMGALSGAVPTGLSSPSPITPRRSNAPVKTDSRVKRSAPGTKLAPRLTNVSPPAHADRTRGKKVPHPGIASGGS